MKRPFVISLFLLFGTMLSGQSKKQKSTNNTTNDKAWMKAISTADLIKWRRYIHENAELSFKEE